MTDPKSAHSRRDFMRTTGRVAAASALAGVSIPHVHAGESHTIRIALVGCGGRGTGAAANALSVKGGPPIRLVAMADVFEDRIQRSFENLKEDFPEQTSDLCEHRMFVGFDAYKEAIDLLCPHDIVILTTPPAFRWVHFGYAVERRINTFMEKPISVDGPTTRKMLALAEKAREKNIKVGVGLMCRHCQARQELHEQIQDGRIGEILMLRAYRQTGPVGSAFSGPKPDDISELLYQVRRFHSFLWASGGCFSDFLIHNIDEACWMKNAWPIQARGSGARCYREDHIDQNFDTYSVEYTFADGAKLFLEGRNIAGCNPQFASYAHGTKGSAVISNSGHYPARCRTYKGQNFESSDLTWRFRGKEPNPYQREWDHLVQAIRNDEPHNEVKRGAEASLVTAMGRMAAHTGQVITYDQILNSEHEFAPCVDQLTFDSPAPLQMDEHGRYPTPAPGLITDREY